MAWNFLCIVFLSVLTNGMPLVIGSVLTDLWSAYVFGRRNDEVFVQLIRNPGFIALL